MVPSIMLRRIAIIATIGLSLGGQACNKSNSPNSPQVPVVAPPVLAVTRISPDSAAANSSLTIYGTGFNATAAADIVQINGVTASIQSASPDSLHVTVPPGAGSGKVSVTVYGTNAVGPLFTYLFTATVSTLAGGGTGGTGIFKDGPGASAEFNEPYGLAVDQQGNVYVADDANSRIRLITAAGVVSTLAGNGYSNYINGTGTTAAFSLPRGVAVDGQGNAYVADNGNVRIRLISPGEVVSTLAGTGFFGAMNGPGASASFTSPYGVALDTLGNLYVADAGNQRIRMISPTDIVSTVAGNGTANFKDATTGASAEFNSPQGIAVDGRGNLYVADAGNNRIRKISAAGVVSTVAGDGTASFKDASTGLSAEFNLPSGVAIDGQGNLYVADQMNNRIRMISAAGVVSTLAGDGTANFKDGPGSSSQFNGPSGIAVDKQGNIYVADQYNSRIRKITLQ